MAIYDIKNLTFSYGEQDKKVLCNINLQIEQGGFYLISGKSGSGKSTLLKLLKKEISPLGSMQGDIFYCGGKLSELENKKSVSEIGYADQDIERGLVCDKVWKELSFGLGNLGYSDEFIASRVSEVCEYFGISKWYNKKISELSGGSKQIVLLASIMTMSPKVLLLDEPTSMLDTIAKRNFAMLLARLNKELGITIVAIEHNMESLFELASHVIVMDSGKIVAIEEPVKLAQKLTDFDYAQYIGLTEFAEIFARLGGSSEMPKDIVSKREWLKERLKDKLQFAKIQNNESDLKNKKYNKNDVVLSAEKLFFRYSKKGEDIVKGVDLELYKNEIVCLVGGNGGGKTTFVGILTGTTKAHSGKLKVDKSKRISMLPQNAKGLFVENSVFDELRVTAKLLGVSQNIVTDLMTKFDLEQIKNNHPYDISGGEVQRLALAKLFLTDPDIIILDEPTQGMDIESKEYLKKLLFEQKSLEKSVIIITHDLRFAADVADRVGIFFDGKILSLASAQKFFDTNNLYTTESSLLTRTFAKGLYSVNAIADLYFGKN